MSTRRIGFCSVMLLSVCILAALHLSVDAEPASTAEGVPPAAVPQVHPPEPSANDVPPRLAAPQPGIRTAKRYLIDYRLVAAPVNGVPTEKIISAGEISAAEGDPFFVHGTDDVVASGTGELVWLGPSCRGVIRPANEQQVTVDAALDELAGGPMTSDTVVTGQVIRTRFTVRLGEPLHLSFPSNIQLRLTVREQDGTRSRPVEPTGIAPAGQGDSPFIERIQRIEQRLEALEQRREQGYPGGRRARE